MKFNSSFGVWLRQRRKALDLTQDDLAEQVGCSASLVRKLEAGERRPSVQISELLADVLAIAAADRADFVAFARRFASALPENLAAFRPLSSLPAQATPFIGRERELEQIAERLEDTACRLLTLLGAGGMGKTRLALQAASQQLANFADGVYFVPLTPVGSTTFLAAAIASALDFSFYGSDDPNVQLIHYLSGKHLLLVLDNYEHLLAGIDLLTDMLAQAPRLKLLVTSRERLNLHEEWLLPVEGLPLTAAVDLFVQTARRVQPHFALDAQQAAVIAIDEAVEGMPLGLELAASWLRAMSCQQIAAQIKRDLSFLTTTLHNIPDRHRSLRAVFEQSWRLLTALERSALMKLTVFCGGVDPEVAEPIVQASRMLLADLVDKSLVRLNPAQRYELHELLRQFAAEKLLASGQAAATRTSHLHVFLELAEQLERQLFGPHVLPALERLELEHDNFRAALDWALQSGDYEAGLQLAGFLGQFWVRRTYWKEGFNWLERFLAGGWRGSTTIRAKALRYALDLAIDCQQTPNPAPLLAEAMILVQQVDDPAVKAGLLSTLGSFGDYQNPEHNQALLQEALTIFTQLNHQWGICETLSRLAVDQLQRGAFESASRFLRDSIRVARQAQDKNLLPGLVMLLGCSNWYQGLRNPQTERLYQESFELFHELRFKHGMAMTLCQLGKFAHLRGEDERAQTLFQQTLVLTQQIGQKHYLVVCLLKLAELLSRHQEAERAARLIGAVHDDAQTLFAGTFAADQDARLDYEHSWAAARAALDETTFAAAFAEGQRLTLDQAITDALANADFRT